MAEEKGETPLLEWIAAAIGLLLLLTVVGLIAREAIRGEDDQLPAVEIAARRVAPAGAGWVVEFDAINRSGGTAAALTVEGELKRGSEAPETSTATLDYVPGKGKVTGGLFFTHDPRAGTLTLRATGYQRP